MKLKSNTELSCDNPLDLAILEDVLSEKDMEWTRPKYSRKDVNWAGEFLVRDPSVNQRKINRSVTIINNFRAAHEFPLNTLQNRLRILASPIDRNSIVAQRLKRMSSIWAKLERFDTMELWDMQDIGGCRAVVSSIEKVQQLVGAFKSSRVRHNLVREKDYIQQPKDSGYRSRHLVYRYNSDKNEIYNGLYIEIQVRTSIQHAWATTVETVDTFTQQALKSSRGRLDWERFFQLMGTEMALREGTHPVPNTPTDILELRQELRICADELQVIASLAGFANALRVTRNASAKDKDADYYLLSLDNVAERLNVSGYNRRELKQASKAYALKEKQIRNKKGNDAVLVSVDTIRNLRRAYPNYFADTSRFVEELKEALKY